MVALRLGSGPWGAACPYIPFDYRKHEHAATWERAAAVARSVCRSLGLQGGVPQGPIYGRDRAAAVHNLACVGDEAGLSACSFTLPSVPCQHDPMWTPAEAGAYLAVACAGQLAVSGEAWGGT